MLIPAPTKADGHACVNADNNGGTDSGGRYLKVEGRGCRCRLRDHPRLWRRRRGQR